MNTSTGHIVSKSIVDDLRRKGSKIANFFKEIPEDMIEAVSGMNRKQRREFYRKNKMLFAPSPTINIKVESTQGEIWIGGIREDTTLEEICTIVIKEQGYVPEGQYSLSKEDTPGFLDLKKMVRDYGLEDRDVLFFNDLGGAV